MSIDIVLVAHKHFDLTVAELVAKTYRISETEILGSRPVFDHSLNFTGKLNVTI
jgi:hypothetical protein